jgi:hypothetical protein
MKDVRIETVETRRGGIDRELFERQRQLDQLGPREITTRGLIQERISNLNGERSELQDRLRDIRSGN